MRALTEQVNELDGIEIYGRVVGVRGQMVEVAGPIHAMSVGARVVIDTAAKPIPCEVVGFAGSVALLMPFAPLEGVRRGCQAARRPIRSAIRRRRRTPAKGSARRSISGCARSTHS